MDECMYVWVMEIFIIQKRIKIIYVGKYLVASSYLCSQIIVFY